MLGKGKLAELLGIDLDCLDRLLNPKSYRVWMTETGREIQQPIGWLESVHKRISDLLSRIDLPEYVFSQKGRSYVDNARQHIGPHLLAKTDISKFYPSTTHYMVWNMFVTEFRCAKDVAGILADICCYKQHLPTGSPLGGRVAFFAALPMFDEIARLASSAGNRMTLYVDDVTVSGPGATKEFLAKVRGVIRRHGFKTKEKKSKTFAPYSAKTVTGVIVSNEQVLLPNSRHKKIWTLKQEIRTANKDERAKMLRALKGRESEARIIAR
ncbi:RNA-dependent DNA polymerase [Herbaspirillum robiniae]|uniref:RNA-dependent DNA polymerase n=1 Tax=Herbaspirillum robiniae TaxID=2014887 RepID=A0A246WSX0_9BURK|nr:RNA-dependent DNA polymerase [Herbaspirillum robiniae]